MSQAPVIKIKLDTIKSFHEASGSIYNADTKKVWAANETSADSVLWVAQTFAEYHIDSSHLQCGPLTLLHILEKREHDSVKIYLLKKYNSFLAEEITLSYAADSLKKWDNTTLPDEANHKLSINIPYCINNEIVTKKWELYLLPVKIPGLLFNDKRLTEMPLFVAGEKVRVATQDSALLYFYKVDVASSDYKAAYIRVKENGAFQASKIAGSLRYKERYKIKDTLVIGRKLFKIDSIDEEWNYVYLHALKEGKELVKLPEQYIKELQPYFAKSKDKMVIDFWGTWCAPCIATMPQLKELYEKTKYEINFLSVCSDAPKNQAKAKIIISQRKITWPQLFNERKEDAENLTNYLQVFCFPTYMIIDKKGNVIFSDCGTEGFKELERLVLNKKY